MRHIQTPNEKSETSPPCSKLTHSYSPDGRSRALYFAHAAQERIAENERDRVICLCEAGCFDVLGKDVYAN
jgi:hypothetical protein